jgi:acyl-CoA reductase-like NAD-dependent aldehyde dehydrogenase
VNKGAIGSIVGIVAVAFALVVSGCGGGGSDSLTKAEFAKKADEICRRGESERSEAIQAAAQKFSGKKVTAADQEQIVLSALPSYEKEAEKIEELGAPEGEEKQAEALVEAMEEAAENVKADPGTATTGSIPFKKANEVAEEIGAKGCVV